MMIGGFKEEGEFPYFLTFDQLTLVFYENKILMSEFVIATC